MSLEIKKVDEANKLIKQLGHTSSFSENKLSMELTHISNFCSVKRMRVFDTNPSQVSSYP